MDVVIIRDDEEPSVSARPSEPADRFSRLPEAVHLEDTVATHDVQPRANVDVGRDAERDFMLRYAG